MAFDPISAAMDIGGKLIDRLWPDPTQRDAAKLELLKMQQTGELAILAANTELAKGQIAVNAEEAKSSSMFVAGARPFIMWVCGFGLAYHTLIQPLLTFLIVSTGHTIALPVFDTELLNTTLFGMLGLGTMRTVEKIKGVATK